MKNYLLFFLLSLFYTSSIFAQKTVSVKKIKPIKEISSGFRPVFVGDRGLIYTSQSNKGLYYYDLKKKNIQKLCDDTGAGAQFKISKNEKKLVYKSYAFDEYGRRQNSVYEIDITSGKKNEIVKNQRILSTLSYSGDTPVFLQNNSLKSLSENSLKKADDELLAFTDADLNLIISRNGTQKKINPLGEGNYIWVSVSPDRTKILFTKTGKGTFICNKEGEILADLGRINAPKWSKDGKWIIGMDDYDDGQKYTRSQIVFVSPDGKNRQKLTLKSVKVALYPDISQNNKQVVFNDENGKVYLLNLKFR